MSKTSSNENSSTTSSEQQQVEAATEETINTTTSSSSSSWLKSLLKYGSWVVVGTGWAAVMGLSIFHRFKPVNPDPSIDPRALEYVGSTYTLKQGYPALALHASCGMVCLGLGIFQFQESFRARHMKLHKWMGYIFNSSIVLGAIGSIGLIPYSAGGLATKSAFTLLTSIWVGTMGMAMAYVLPKWINPFKSLINKEKEYRIQKHREWMIRCYATVMSSISLRVYLALFTVYNIFQQKEGINVDAAVKDSYTSSVWLSFVTNLILSEIYINCVYRK